MIGTRSSSKLTWLFTVCILIVSLTTSCSAGAGSQAQSHTNSAAALNSSDRSSAEIVKPVQSDKQTNPTDNKPLKKAVQGLAVEQPTVPPAGDPILPAAPSTTGSLAAAPASALEPPAPASQNPPPVPNPVIDPNLAVGPQVGLRAPDFSLQTLDGKPFRLSEMAGRPVLINYWATWCIPCKVELPILEKLHQEYQQKGLYIVSVNAIDQDSVDKVQGIVDQFSMTFPVLLDQGGQFASLYKTMFFPTTVLVDASGVIREINLGDSTEDELRLSLDKILAGGL